MEREFSAPVRRRGSELKLVMEAEQKGEPFLQFRNAEDELLILPIRSETITIGRAPDNDLAISWDREVSRFHAELEQRGGQWIITDEGLARNGTFVDGERVVGRRRLTDGGLVRFGKTVVMFRDPNRAPGTETTQFGSAATLTPELTQTQLDVLAALSRPILTGERSVTTPATNQEIAEELFLSVDAVKGHLRVLFQKFGIADLPQNRKRTALVDKAIVAGLARGN